MNLVPFPRPTPKVSPVSTRSSLSSPKPSLPLPPPSEIALLIRRNIDRHQILSLTRPSAALFLLNFLDQYYKRYGL